MDNYATKHFYRLKTQYIKEKGHIIDVSLISYSKSYDTLYKQKKRQLASHLSKPSIFTNRQFYTKNNNLLTNTMQRYIKESVIPNSLTLINRMPYFAL